MAVIAIGDIHGNLTALRDVLGQIQRDLAPADTIVFLGDYIDRGPDSRGCIDEILALRARHESVVCLYGNHEVWMLQTRENHERHSWLLAMDALDTVRSYSAEAERALVDAMSEAGVALYLRGTSLPYDRFFDAMPDEHHRFFDELDLSFEADGCFYSHAGVDPAVAAPAEQSEDALLWGVLGFPRGYRGAATVVYGHWNNAQVDASGRSRPKIVGNTIGIDTSARGVLTAIRMPERHVYQSGRR